MADINERVAKLEGHREEHEGRHTRFETAIETLFGKIDKRLENGDGKFDSISGKVDGVAVQLSEHCKHDRANGYHPSKKETVIKVVLPSALGGSGILAFIIWVITTMAKRLP